MDAIPATQCFDSGDGRRIYAFPVRSFPNLVNNIYLIAGGEQLILVDCGSGMPDADRDLIAGMDALRRDYGLKASLADIDIILVTHGHIDHFGGLPFLREHTAAPIGVHRLDRRVLSNHEERVIVASRALEHFLAGAGVAPEKRAQLMQVYLFSKGYYRSTAVQFELVDGEKSVDDIDVIHVPGHCPGQVCLQVGEILLTADHILSRTTPHQAPESITRNMGLGHYLDSLAKIAARPAPRLALGGHEAPMDDVPARIAAIEAAHEERLARIVAICESPQSVASISRALFGDVSSYHVLLALEETGAHVEYLYQRGELAAANLDEIESQPDPVFRYQRT